MTAPAGDWFAMHIFYAANPQPLLTQCIAPLVAELEADGLTAGHFFINYWLEGAHVRLRLRPATPDVEPQVRARAERAVQAYLERRPALYQMGHGYLGELFDILFELEFPQGRPAELIGDDGRMVLQPNNSFQYRPYEPEYGKYGGPAGVELAEWHFTHSTDLVLDVLGTTNAHLRTVLLGTAAQLMLVMAATFLPDRRDLADFLEQYHHFWHRAFSGTDLVGTSEYERMYEPMAPEVAARMTSVLDALESGDLEALPRTLRGWAEHSAQLRDRVVELAEAGVLVFSSWDGTTDIRQSDPAQALRTLLSPYLHMTNNRFHVTLRDEAYLSYLMFRVLREELAVAAR